MTPKMPWQRNDDSRPENPPSKRRQPAPDMKEFRDTRRQLERARRRLEALETENASLRVRLSGMSSGEGFHSRDGSSGVEPENIVWILGSGRTGSSWLAFMFSEMDGFTRWNEPLVGYLFGHLIEERATHRQEKKHFILAKDYEEVWLDSMRALILDGANARFPALTQDGGYLVIKEPHSARNAPLIMKSLPESRLLFLVRDPRDMVASTLTWSRTRERSGHTEREKRVEEAEKRPDVFVRKCAINYLKDIEAATQAFDEHGGYRCVVRYEDLRRDTHSTMERIRTELGLQTEDTQLRAAIDKHAWENLPEERKGEGKIRRKASPGGWREDLTAKQVRTVEDICSGIFEQYYPDEKVGSHQRSSR